jgi:phytoene dehydrogenase-like protein
MENIDSNKVWDFIVIGGGINGLAIAAILSNDGYDVLVLEKQQEVGGRCKTIEKEGFLLDNGLHLMKYGSKSVLNELLSQSNVNFNNKDIIPIKNYHLNIGDEIEELKKKVSGKCLKEEKWAEKSWIKVPGNVNLMRKCDYFDIWKLIRIYTTCFKCEYSDIKDMSLIKFLAEKKLCRASGCVAIERYIKLVSSAIMHISDSKLMSAGEVMRFIKWGSKMDTLFGYPPNGWNDIINRFRNKIEQHGRILTKCEAKNLLFKKNSTEEDIAIIDLLKITGVNTSLGKIKSNNVIIAIPPKQVSPLFKEIGIIKRLVPDYQDILDNFVPVSGISIDIAVDAQIYNGKSFVYTEDPPGYGALISNIQQNLAPPGKQLISFIFIMPHDEFLDIDKREAFKIKAKNMIHEYYPKINDHIQFERILEHEYMDSVQVNKNQHIETRPKPKVPGIQGCYLTGDYLRSYGASGEMGYNGVLMTLKKIKKIENRNFL